MPMLRITAIEATPRLHGSSHETQVPLRTALRAALTRDPGPVTVMVHGYRYAPGAGRDCPHDTLFAQPPLPDVARVVSWPRHLGLRGQHGEGLGLSFGWHARGRFSVVHRRAEEAGLALSRLLTELRALAPQRPVRVIGHSLGARVILSAIRQGAPGMINHAVLLAGAEFQSTTHAILTAPSGKKTRVLNVTTRENDLFDFVMEQLVTPDVAGDRMLGAGPLADAAPNLVSLQLDDPRSLEALRQVGFPIAPPQRRICHWSPYLRAGVFPLYRAVLDEEMPLDRLRALLPTTPAARWSRLLTIRPDVVMERVLRPLTGWRSPDLPAK